MFDKIAKIVLKLGVDEWMYICLGVIGLVFIIGLILTVGTGNANKFKSKAKAAIKHPDVSFIQANAKAMPGRVRKLYKRVKISGEKPSDVITVEACVNTPYAASFAPRFGRTVMAAAMFMAAFMYVIGSLLSGRVVASPNDNYLIATALVIAAGFILRLLAGMISMGNQKGALKAYEKYIDVLDDVIKAEEKAVEFASIEQNASENAQNIEDSEKPQETENVIQFGFDEQAKADETAQNAMFAEINAFGAPILEQAEDAENKAKAKEAALAEAREAEMRAQAEAMARVQAEAAAAERAKIVEAAPVISSGVDDVVGKIDKIAREGASLSEMKEVAMQLQRERAKQENKTPEASRKLNEALASLLKSLSTATKR